MVRVEDGPLLRGQGRFVDDLDIPGALHVAFLRSPVAHGRLNGIDASAAKALSGVHAVLTFADLRPLLTSDRIPQALPSGAIRFHVDPYVLAKHEVTYVGEPVAMVAADSRRVAEDALDEPFEDVADGGLAGLDAVVAGQDRALDDAADSRDVGHLLVRGHHAAVARGGADDLDERAFGDAAADGAVVHVELADRNWNSGAQSKLARPLLAKRPGGLGGIVRLHEQPVAETRELRIEETQELFVRQTAPVVAKKGFVAGRANAALHLGGIGHTGQHRGHPVGKLHPRVSGVENLRGDGEAVPDLRPPPF